MGSRLSRREFLDRRREICRARYDQLHAHTYDQVWGQVDPTHAECVSALVATTPPGGELLDAACGTGKYWPPLLEPDGEVDADLVAGEVLADGAYHYYPSRAQVHRWLAGAGFEVTGERTGDGYLHLHCRASHPPGVAPRP